mgnify:CR=1 FL=1
MSEKESNGTRLREIISVIHKHQIARGVTPEKLRLILEDLGPTYIKLGQIMSMRSDIFPKKICDEFMRLRSEVTPMPFSEVREVIEHAYGMKLEDVFEEIQETPIGSASIAQVHKAKLKSGETVVVKVQRKGIYETMSRDIAFLHRAVKLMPPINMAGLVDMNQVLDEMWVVAQDEMNAVQANNDYRLALLDLSQLIELETPEGFLLEEPAVKIELTPLTPPDEIFQIALGSKASIQAAQYRLEGSKHSIRIAQSGYYPQLSFNGSLGTNYYSTINRTFSQQMSDNFNKYIGFNLSVPIFNRLATRNRVRTARLQRENYSLQLDNAKKNLYKEIQQAWYNAAASESKYTSSSTAASASKASFKLMSEKYENGKANAVEYNEAKQNLMKAQSDELQAKYEYLFRTKILDFYKGEPIE